MWLKKIRTRAAKFFNGPPVKAAPKKRFTISAPLDNDVQLESAGFLEGSIKIVKGTGNVIRFGAGCRFSGSIYLLGDFNLIEIGAAANIKGKIIVKGNKQRVVIGDHTTSDEVRLLCSENCNITIGQGCAFTHGIEIRTTDAHSVVDRETGNRLNPPGSVAIGDHVWVGSGVILNKGSNVPSGSMVEAMSFVSHVFEEERVVLAGIPAKVTERGINWSRVTCF